MLIALILIFIAVPVLEIYLFIRVGALIGTLPCIALVVLAAALGAFILRTQTLQAIGRVQDSVRRGVAPVNEVMDGLALVAAGGLLILPGFFTDMIGLLLLIPWVRRTLGYALLYRLLKPSANTRGAAAGGAIDGEFEVVDTPRPPDPPRLPPSP